MRESTVIAGIVARNAELAAMGGARVVVPPGDDMALVELGGRRVLCAADQVIEHRHWDAGTPLELVARKALARNVSDIAAMAGVPSCALATAAFAADAREADAEALAEGFRRAGREFRCPVVGGDVGMHAAPGAPLVVSVSVLAEPGPTGRVVTRAGARPGDLLCVTGRLGNAWGPGGTGRHLAFVPRTAEALELVHVLGDRLHAMIDVSDGLAVDARHLAQASGCSVEVDAAALPCADGAAWKSALGAGEDYELAFACDGPPPAEVCGTPVTVVGRFIERQAPWVTALVDGARLDAGNLGWEHGRPEHAP